MKRAVFFDIDGTLAIRRDIPPSAVSALERLRNNDSAVFLCTGRNANYVQTYFSSFADGFICANGRYAYLNEQVLYDHPIDPAVLSRILTAALTHQCGVIFFGNQHGYYSGDPAGYELFSHSGPDKTPLRLESIEAMEPIYTFDAYFPSEKQQAALSAALMDICLFNPHGPYPTADATVFGHDKGTALSAVIHKLCIPREQTYAFGDGRNDICMFEAAGHGIAMGNALEEVKEAAEFVTSGILEDGISNGLSHYGLI